MNRIPNILKLFPIVYLFTFFPIPGIGSPEKLFTFFLLILLCMHLALSPRTFNFDPKIDFSFLLFIALHIPALYYSTGSLNDNISMTISHLSMWVFVYIIIKMTKEKRQIEGCINGMMIMTLLVFVVFIYLIYKYKNPFFYRILEEFGDIKTSTFAQYTFLNNPNRLSRVLLMVYPFVFLYILHSRGILKRSLGYFLAIVTPPMIILTISKMGIITLIITTVLLYLVFRKRTKIFRLIFIAFLVVGIISSQMITLRVTKLISQYERRDTVQRYETWKAGVKGWLEHPLFGAGSGYEAVYSSMYKHGGTQTSAATRETVAKATHSTYINTLVQTGAAGFFALLLFFYYIIRRIQKSIKITLHRTFFDDFLCCGLIAMISVGLMGITAISIWLNIFWYILGILYAGTKIIMKYPTIKIEREGLREMRYVET